MEYISQKVAICSIWTVCPWFEVKHVLSEKKWTTAVDAVKYHEITNFSLRVHIVFSSTMFYDYTIHFYRPKEAIDSKYI